MTQHDQPRGEAEAAPHASIRFDSNGHVHFTDPERERFANDVWKFGEQLLAESNGELSEALERAERMA